MKRPITPRGYQILRQELDRLKSTRPELAEAIATARAHGDLSENADYDAAKNASGLTEAKIREIEGQLAEAQVIDPSTLPTPERVTFGATVRVEDSDSGEQRIYSIYGPEEADPKRGWISYETPIARALIGKSLGDEITVNLPVGQKYFEILDIYIDYPQDLTTDS